MTDRMLVGEFSRLTHLTTKALHHYHQLGLLEPAGVDPGSGYRYYSPDQVDRAHLVRRLRAARMPLAQIQATLSATGVEREQQLMNHLDVLRGELLQTAAAVTSLSALLGRVEPAVRRSQIPAQHCLGSSSEVTPADLGSWCSDIYPRLATAVRALGLHPQGAYGAMYDTSWFSGDGGSVTAFLPVDSPVPQGLTLESLEGGVSEITLFDVPAGTYLSAVHEGPCSELDLTYGHLGRHVLARGSGKEGPIREHYVVTAADTSDPRALRTEIYWPVMAV